MNDVNVNIAGQCAYENFSFVYFGYALYISAHMVRKFNRVRFVLLV